MKSTFLWLVSVTIAGSPPIDDILHSIALGQGSCTDDPNCKLWQAIENHNVSLVKQSIKEGADVNEIYRLNPCTPLTQASGNGNNKIVKILIEHDADVNATDKFNATALIAASSNPPPYLEVMKSLIDGKADVTAHENKALDLPAWYGIRNRPEAMELLLENKADVEHEDSQGHTLLIRAMYHFYIMNEDHIDSGSKKKVVDILINLLIH